MHKEKRDLLDILRHEILGDTGSLPEVTPELYQLAEKHGFSHLLAGTVKKSGASLSGELREKLQKQQLAAVWRHEQMQYEQERILNALETAGIDHMLLKGDVVRQYYPQPWMRRSCDIDVLVRREELEKAVQTLTEKLNYQDQGKHYHDVSMRSPGGVHLELHFSLNVHSEAADRALADVWHHVKPAENCTCRYEMEPTFFLFYFIAHMAGHFLRGGCGVRTVLDLYLLEKNLTHDGEKLSALLAESGLRQFHAGLTKVARVWFEEEQEDGATDAVGEYILNGGSYGTLDNRIAVTKQQAGGSEAGYWYRRLFMSRELLTGVYPQLEHRPALYPYYQVKRWLRFLNGNTRKRIVGEFGRSRGMSGEQLHTAKDILTHLGLRPQ